LNNALNLMPNSIMSKGMSWGELRCRCTSIAQHGAFHGTNTKLVCSIRQRALDGRQPSHDGHDDNDQDAGNMST
jgi:hypothetical protein